MPDVAGEPGGETTRQTRRSTVDDAYLRYAACLVLWHVKTMRTAGWTRTAHSAAPLAGETASVHVSHSNRAAVYALVVFLTHKASPLRPRTPKKVLPITHQHRVETCCDRRFSHPCLATAAVLAVALLRPCVRAKKISIIIMMINTHPSVQRMCLCGCDKRFGAPVASFSPVLSGHPGQILATAFLTASFAPGDDSFQGFN